VEPRVAVVGVGHAGFAPITAGLSYKELMFEAAQRAYADAQVDPRADVDSFVCCSEDYLEGTSIFDEYVPDQLGAVQRPVQTVAADGLFGVATALLLIRSGAARVVAVEAHSKVSDVLTLGAIERFAMDPVFNRPLGVPAVAVAGLDMNAFLERTGFTEEHCAMVAAKNRTNALDNPKAAYPADVTAEDVEDSGPVYWPLRELVQEAAGVVTRESVLELLTGADDAVPVADHLAAALGLAETDGTSEEEISWAVRRLLETLAQRRPLLVVLEGGDENAGETRGLGWHERLRILIWPQQGPAELKRRVALRRIHGKDVAEVVERLGAVVETECEERGFPPDRHVVSVETERLAEGRARAGLSRRQRVL